MFSKTEILLYLFLVGAALIYIFGKRRKNFPPGFTPYPIIGNILQIDKDLRTTYCKHAKKLGPISSLKLGFDNYVIIHDLKLIKDALNEGAISGRPKNAVMDFLVGKNDGILNAEGRVWVEQRRFSLRTLRDFGFGKKGMESMILDEVQELMDWIGKQSGKPICLHGRMNLAGMNALWTLLTGIRYEHDDPKLLKLIEDLEVVAATLMKEKIPNLLIAIYPRLAKLFPNWSRWNYLTSLVKMREDLFDGIIEEHRKNRAEGHSRDFIDVYLREVDKTDDFNSSFHHSTAYKSLRSVLSDFFLAGSDTTSATLNWAILYLIYYPEIQKKLHEELDRVVGNSRLPSLTDRNSLVYTEAFTMELLRFSTIAPLGVPHTTMEDVEFHGFSLPKGTIIYPNIYAVHFDPNIWGDPEVFRPERFLSQDGLTLQKNDCLIPFGTGKRTCLGFNLALDQIFLFITSILQRFDISAETGKLKPTLVPQDGQANLTPQPYSVVMTERL